MRQEPWDSCANLKKRHMQKSKFENQKYTERPLSWGKSKVETLIKKNKTKPFQSLEELPTGFAPQDESADEFNKTIRQWRREGLK